jgi:hypothetical protein
MTFASLTLFCFAIVELLVGGIQEIIRSRNRSSVCDLGTLRLSELYPRLDSDWLMEDPPAVRAAASPTTIMQFPSSHLQHSILFPPYSVLPV